ncbi:GIY-YIG nuclease family protein [Candidatus Peregrinibacteria bacterium]|nr:MAG: GIY-YIG nuclease family protein [Candidatus Peregrinibacteria bacterium]
MYYVYILRSLKVLNETYVGFSTDFERRLAEHNLGKSIHTNKFKPWKIDVLVSFENRKKAEAFEKYLKTGSGRAFAKRHFI